MVMPSLFIASQSSCFIFCSPRTNSPDGKQALEQGFYAASNVLPLEVMLIVPVMHFKTI
jgi:hypothetical protein